MPKPPDHRSSDAIQDAAAWLAKKKRTPLPVTLAAKERFGLRGAEVNRAVQIAAKLRHRDAIARGRLKP